MQGLQPYLGRDLHCWSDSYHKMHHTIQHGWAITKAVHSYGHPPVSWKRVGAPLILYGQIGRRQEVGWTEWKRNRKEQSSLKLGKDHLCARPGGLPGSIQSASMQLLTQVLVDPAGQQKLTPACNFPTGCSPCSGGAIASMGGEGLIGLDCYFAKWNFSHK